MGGLYSCRGRPPSLPPVSNQKYVVQVQTEQGWATITNRSSRENAHRLAARLGGRVFNLWTRRPSEPRK